MPSDSFSSSSSGSKNQLFQTRSRTWTNTPNYRSVLRDNRPVNPYIDEKHGGSQITYAGGYDRNNSTGVVTTTVPAGLTYTNQNIIDGTSSGLVSADFVSIANATAAANLIQLLGKISDAKTNLAVTLAEAHKTSAMILGTAKRISDAYRSFRRGNFREVARQLDLPLGRVHKTWLAYKYGWTPLLMDVKSSAEFFAQQTLGGRPPRFSVQSTKVAQVKWASSGTYAAYGGGADGTYTKTLTGSYTNRMKVWIEVSNPNFSALQQLGLTNPLLVAWELVPFSFVFDWFCHVGNYLQGLTALNGLTIRRALQSNVNDLTFSYDQPTTIRVSGGHTYTNSHQHYDGKWRDYGRNFLSIDPLTMFPPVRTDLFNFQKLVTSLALLRAVSR